MYGYLKQVFVGYYISKFFFNCSWSFELEQSGCMLSFVFPLEAWSLSFSLACYVLMCYPNWSCSSGAEETPTQSVVMLCVFCSVPGCLIMGRHKNISHFIFNENILGWILHTMKVTICKRRVSLLTICVSTNFV